MHRHFLIHKPINFVSQFIYPHKRKKGLLGDLYKFPQGTMAIGRLDVKSEGLLLLTTDGKFSNQVRSKCVEKEYYVQVDGIVTTKETELLKKGVEIGVDGKKYVAIAKHASIIDDPNFTNENIKVRDERHGPTSWLSITINEGKFRQVRKMTAAVGLPTLRLVRVRVGHLKIDQFEPGKVIELCGADIEKFKN